VRSTELNAVLGRSQLRRLDQNNVVRSRNLRLFLEQLDPEVFRTDFATEGSCNYALTLILRHADADLNHRVAQTMKQAGVEYRRGTAGGGNQLRQPYLRKLLGDQEHRHYPVVDHVHFYGYYLGNYPELEPAKITALCGLLNRLAGNQSAR
jgi:CDP-6-deoxy-D-xylo-4-hexulose-3-dehydrase